MRRGASDHGTVSRQRAVQFMVLAASLWLIAAILSLLDIELWPAWVAGTGLFVCSQAWLKWQDGRRYRLMEEQAAAKAKQAAPPQRRQDGAQ